MFLSKKTIAALGGTLMLTAVSTSALAIGGVGGIVYDPTNYAQAVKQVQAWAQQYNQMRDSIQKAQATFERVKAQYDALTGARGFGDLLNNPVLRHVVPTDLSMTLDSLNSTGLLSGKALDIRTGSQIYDCGDITDARAKTSCQVLLGQNAQALAFQRDTMALLNQRTTQIEGLRAQINATQDPKAIAELQARIAIEEAQVSNDQNKLQMAQAMLESNRRAAAQSEAERVNALMATDKVSVLDNFNFTNLGYAAGPDSQGQ
ncbi:type IV secretion system protein [Asticcacaulis sp. W401b]|uniref:type IV secretion system protein n=1 Tax=Asticcacaulis sp. W401b TaxID=3388666 RepID=UPI003970BC3E